MPEFHAEPYVYLADLTHKSALTAWGAFYFKTHSNGRAKLVEDEDLRSTSTWRGTRPAPDYGRRPPRR
jgi:hypothetical protein